MNLLQIMLKERMDRERLSTRKAARLVGVSHTTIARVLNGQSADIKTLLALCDWLGISPEAVMGREPSADNLAKQIATIVEKNPKLKEVLTEAVRRVEHGEIKPSVLEDIVSYISYRINL